ncbi:hypothetical protein [Lichenihabitans psoromatis]|nr:hypothetical protein [Lichenihabitans psoromatis]
MIKSHRSKPIKMSIAAALLGTMALSHNVQAEAAMIERAASAQ